MRGPQFSGCKSTARYRSVTDPQRQTRPRPPMSEPALTAAREPRRGRDARRAARAHRSHESVPYITRTIPLTEMLSEEGLAHHRAQRRDAAAGDRHRVSRLSRARSIAFAAQAATSRASACGFPAASPGSSARPRRRAMCSTRAIPSATSSSAATRWCSRRITARPSSTISTRAAATARSRISRIS